MGKKRENCDAVLEALLGLGDVAFDGWTYQEDIAEATSLSIGQVRAAFNHLRLEYGAVRVLPMTKAVQLEENGVGRYFDHIRNYHPQRLAFEERQNVARGLTPNGKVRV